MKKIPIFLSTLTVGLGALTLQVPNTSALHQDTNGTNWWTVEELLDFSKEVEAEKTALCGEDQGCLMDFNYSMIEKGEKYRALDNLMQMQFWITSVNPGENTLKALYFDEDPMLRRMGIEERADLDLYYVGWFEEWKDQIFYLSKEQLINSPSVEGQHTIFYDSADRSDEGWFPVGKEVAISGFADSALKDNTSGRLGYVAYGGMFNAHGSFDYSACLRAEDYVEGVECKMMVSADKWVTYLPIKETVIELEEMPRIITSEDDTEPELPEETHLETNETPNENSVEDPNENSNENPDEKLDENPNEDSNETSEPNVEASQPKETGQINIGTPETGAPTASERESSEFPWWFKLMLVLNVAVLAWLFWPYPKTHPKIKKSGKKS